MLKIVKMESHEQQFALIGRFLMDHWVDCNLEVDSVSLAVEYFPT